jgi:exoenzyme U
MTMSLISFRSSYPVYPTNTESSGAEACNPELSAITARAEPVQPFKNGEIFSQTTGSHGVTLSYKDDQFVIEKRKPAASALVFSGGGGKGNAYPGVMLALEQSNVLASVRDLYGASAGAITAALMASGMSASEFRELSRELDMVSLMHGKPDEKTGYTIKYRHPILAKLSSMLGNLNGNGFPLEEVIRSEVRANVICKLKQWLDENNDNPPQAKTMKEYLSHLSNSQPVTFGMLRDISRVIPEIKALHCTALLRSDHDELPAQPVLFDAECFPDLDVAKAVRASAGFPIAFSKTSIDTAFNYLLHSFGKNAEALSKDDSDGEKIEFKFSDGGTWNNVPARIFIDPNAPKEEMIIFTFSPPKPKSTVSTLFAEISDRLAGFDNAGANFATSADLMKYLDSVVVIPLDFPATTDEHGVAHPAISMNGLFRGTLKFSLSEYERSTLQNGAAKATAEHLKNRKPTEESACSTLDELFLALSDAELDAVMESPISHDVFRKAVEAHWNLRTQAREMCDRLENIVKPTDSLKNIDDILRGFIDGISGIVDDDVAINKYIANRFNDDKKPLVRVAERLAYQRISNNATVEAIVNEYERREVRAIAHAFIHNVIPPAIFIYWQSSGNRNLLMETKERLDKSETREDVLLALDDLRRGYRSRVSSQLPPPLNSWTIEKTNQAYEATAAKLRGFAMPGALKL